MKKQILFGVMLGVLLVACTTKNEPISDEPHRINDGTQRSLAGQYEELYDIIQAMLPSRVMEYDDINDLWMSVMHGGYSTTDTSYINIQYTMNNYLDDVVDLFYDILSQSNMYLDLEKDTVLDENVMLYYLSEIQDSVYITPSFRERVFEDIHIGNYEKFSLCLIFAIKNLIYEDFHNHTVLVTDMYNRYSIFQLTNISSTSLVHWTSPCDIYEIHVADISLIDTAMISSYIELDVGIYIPFNSHESKMNYLGDIANHYDIYYVTSEECEERKEAAMDALECEIAAAIIISSAGGPEAVCLTAAGCTAYYLIKRAAIKADYRDCLEEAEDNND